MSRYETDFYGWTQEQSALLKAGRFAEADLEHIAEEIDSMGRAEKRQLVNRLRLLSADLLKWQFQPERQGNSWRHAIRNQRRDVDDLIIDNPSLRPSIEDIVAAAYERAKDDAAADTGLSLSTFPEKCPFPIERVLDPDFFP